MRRLALLIIPFFSIGTVSIAQQVVYSPTDPKPFPSILTQAVIAAEDPSFQSRGLWRSPITAQVVRLLEPSKQTNHLDQLIDAIGLDWKYSHTQILALYLNNAYFGRGCYGAPAAAMALFDKSIMEIDLSEAVTVASLLRRPAGGYGDDVYMQAAANQVASQMLEMGMINAEQQQQVIKEVSNRNMTLSGC